MNTNMDINSMMQMLSKMDKKELEQALNKASEILNANQKNDIINKIKGNQ